MRTRIALLGQPGLSQAFHHRRYVRHRLDPPFDHERILEPLGLRQGGIRLFRLALEHISCCQAFVCVKSAITGVDRPTVFVDGGVDMPETKLRVAQIPMKDAYQGIAWT